VKGGGKRKKQHRLVGRKRKGVAPEKGEGIRKLGNVGEGEKKGCAA